MSRERRGIFTSSWNVLGNSNISGPLHRRGIHDIEGESDSEVDFEIPNICSVKKIQNDTSRNLTVPSCLCDNHLSKSQHSNQYPTCAWNCKCVTNSVPSLLEITAEVVGKTCTWEILEHCSPPLDDTLLRKVAFWAFPTDETKVKAYVHLLDLCRTWSVGKNMVENNRVREMWQVGFMATAYIMKYFKDEDSVISDIHVSLTFERQRILASSCSECKTDVWCAHVIAAVIYRMHYPDRVCVYAPMTETLSTLSRDQLQKIIQYAVYEDPAGILGKIFKHIDAVRDINSDVNTEAGIPDPTFGGIEYANSDWQISLDVLEECLSKNLLALTFCPLSDNMDKYYPASFNKTDKQNAYLSKYFQGVIRLVRCGEYRGATKVLIVIMKNVIKHITDSTIHKTMQYFLHDLCRFYAIVMIYLQDRDPESWELLRNSADEFNRLQLADVIKMKTSLWAELPSLASHFHHLEEDALFYEPVAACMIQTSSSFYKLLDHKPTSIHCCQLEDPSILFARLEGYVKFAENTVSSQENIINLLLHVLIHLCGSAKKHSIIGDRFAEAVTGIYNSSGSDTAFTENKFQTSVNCVKNRGKKRISVVSVSEPEIKKIKTGKGKRSSGQSKGKQLMRKTSDNIATLTKGQLAYGITYCCYILINVERKVNSQPCLKELLLSYIALALELGYFRMSAPVNQITENEHKWLHCLEKNLSAYLQSNINKATKILQIYMEAFTKDGLNFYNGCYPLVLLDTFSYKVSLLPELREKWCSHMIDILSILLKTLPDHIDKYTLYSVHKTSPYLGDGNDKNHSWHSVIPDKMRSLTSVFLSLIQQGNSYHESLVTEILYNLKKLDSITTLIDVEDAVYKLCGMRCGQKLLQALIEFALHAYKRSCEGPVSMHFTLRDLLHSLCVKLGLSSLSLIPKDWLYLFSVRELRDLIFLFEADIRQLDKPPRKVIDLILQVLGKCFQSPQEICDLLSLFKVGDINHRKAIQIVLKNKYAYHQDVLIALSKAIFEKTDGLCKGHDSDCLKLTEAALQQVKHFGPLNDAQIDFLCSIATADSREDISSNIPFQVIVSQFSKSCSQYPDMLVHMLKKLEEAGNLWLKHATEITEALIPAYSNHFCSKLSNCSHSSYSSFVRRMLKARIHCVTYVEDGAKLFYQEVVLRVLYYHQNKRKLISILEKEFPEPH